MKCGNTCVLFLIGISFSTCLAGIIDSIRDGHVIVKANERSNEITSVPMFNQTHQIKSFMPFARLLDKKDEPNDTDPDDGGNGFPEFFTPYQQRHGAVVFCFLVAIYCFTLLAIICDKYFLPSIERLCVVLDISADVGAATFMSVATSCPELFTNIVATFITKSELGIGTIVGSSMFNSLGVASIGSLAAIRTIQLDWWPVTRDISIYMVAVSVLVGIVWDDVIYWYEGLTLFICYFLYFIIIFQNPRISRFVRRKVAQFGNRNKVDATTGLGNGTIRQEEKDDEYNRDSVRASVVSAFGTYVEETRISAYQHSEAFKKAREVEEERELKEIQKSPFIIPEGGFATKLWFFYTWPIKMALRCTMPNPKTYPKLFPITFIICIIWIGSNSYVVSWMVTIIGDVFNIPATVQGMTLVAAGGSLPESLSIAIMSRRGEGKMGVSNSLGANTMNILFSLGMPWFFKTISMGVNNQACIRLHSGSIVYIIMGLIVVALVLFTTLFLNKFRLRKRTGAILLSVYIICIVLACLSEMVFFPV